MSSEVTDWASAGTLSRSTPAPSGEVEITWISGSTCGACASAVVGPSNRAIATSLPHHARIVTPTSPAWSFQRSWQAVSGILQLLREIRARRCSAASGLSGERMLHGLALGGHLCGIGRAGYGALDRLFHGAVIEVLDLLVVVCFPMDEHADTKEEIVRLLDRNDAFRDAVGHGIGNGVLRCAEHLQGLLGAPDRHFVEHDGRRFDHHVRCEQRKYRGKALLVIDQAIRKGGFDGAAARPHDKIDMGDLISVADQRLPDAKSVDLCHLLRLPNWV